MLNGRRVTCPRVLQDALTSHLGLSNSSVSVTDEPGSTRQRSKAEPLSDWLCSTRSLHNGGAFQRAAHRRSGEDYADCVSCKVMKYAGMKYLAANRLKAN